jgi:AraC-like DNA-binding protein
LTPKALIDQRICLEAKRLLVYSTLSGSSLSSLLGFSEPTNFVKFFRRTTGTTPQQFRAAHAVATNRSDLHSDEFA